MIIVKIFEILRIIKWLVTLVMNWESGQAAKRLRELKERRAVNIQKLKEAKTNEERRAALDVIYDSDFM
jgi:hypothetical protein